MTRRLLWVFAIATGLVAANNYYAQPMLDVISRDFHTSVGVTGLIVTLTQIGYVLGLSLIVPLGDYLDRRKLIMRILAVTTLTLIASALAPTLNALLIAAGLVGLTTVVAQMLVPFAATLAEESSRGRVVGTVMSGLLMGILLARTVAGLLSQFFGWRAVFGIGAGATLLILFILARELPRLPAQTQRMTRRAYLALIASPWVLMREEATLRRRALYGALSFAAFSVLWTSIAFLLARPPYSYNQAVIGLFGLVGVAGALAASFAGRWADRGWSLVTTGVFMLVMLISFGLIALGGQYLFPLILGILLLDLGVQGAHITNQSEIYRLRPEARARLTTAYMATYFVGGAIGSATSALVFQHVGWAGVSLLGAGYVAVALVAWLIEVAQHGRRRMQATPTPAIVAADAN